MAYSTCSICGAAGRVTRGWCPKHYYRWQKFGDPLAAPTRIIGDNETRFWSKVNKDGPVPERKPELGPCWVWMAGCSDGYGEFNAGGNRIRPAHCISYEWLVGPVPEGLVLDHLCRNRACVRPTHLEPVTRGENNRRGEAPRVRAAREGVCERGHPQDDPYIKPSGQVACRQCIEDYKLKFRSDPTHPAHRFNRRPGAKFRFLTETQVAEVRRLRARGATYAGIAEQVGCSPSTVWMILSGKRKTKRRVIS